MNDLNHPKVQPLTTEIALQFGLDQSFIDFVFATDRPECFRYDCEDPLAAWTCFVPDSVDVAHPLWSTNGDQTLLLVSGNQLSYGKGWHDHNDLEILSQTSQGLLAHLMNTLYESELSDSELKQAADFCGFKYLDDLIDFCETPIPEDRSWSSVFNDFVTHVDELKT